MSIQFCLCAWRCLLKPDVRFSGFGVAGVCDPPAREAGTELRSLENAVFATEINLQHLLSFH